MRDSPIDDYAWWIATCLVTFVTIWQLIFFFSLSRADCHLRYPFWLADTPGGAPLNLAVYAFSLFTLWALVEIYRAHRVKSPDRWTSTIVCSACLFLSGYMLLGLRAQYESFEVEWGVREGGDITLGSYGPKYLKLYDPLGTYTEFDLWREVHCNPEYKNPKSDEEYCALLKKFDKEHNTMLEYYSGCA